MFSTTNSFSRLIRQDVIVHASGVTYEGKLVEVTSEDVKLRGRTGWIIVPIDRVRKIVKKGEEGPPPLDPTRESSSMLFMDDEQLAAMQQPEPAPGPQAAQPQSPPPPATQPQAPPQPVQTAPPAPAPAAEEATPFVEMIIEDFEDLSELTAGVDFNPIPMAPYDEKTPTEFTQLPGIPQDDLNPLPGGPAQAPPVAPPFGADTGSFRPPSKPSNSRETVSSSSPAAPRPQQPAPQQPAPQQPQAQPVPQQPQPVPQQAAPQPTPSTQRTPAPPPQAQPQRTQPAPQPAPVAPQAAPAQPVPQQPQPVPQAPAQPAPVQTIPQVPPEKPGE